MFGKNHYTFFEGRHRPYLEVVFRNYEIDKNSSKTFAIIDSGADHTVIPYSIGVSIGLKEPTSEEKLANVSGVGGNLSYIKRDCRIYFVNRSKNKIYGFNETVWWIYPDSAMQEERKKLLEDYKTYKNFQEQCKSETELHKHFGLQMEQVIENINKISSRLETGVLLGRPFFDNFEFIQFCHKDREKENLCFLTI